MRLFFIVGAQKSGSTWLQRSLNSMNGVHCLGEGHFIDRLIQPIAETTRSYNQMMQLVADRVYEGNGFYDAIPDAEFRLIMREWILRVLLRNAKADPTSIVAIGDKTPAHSFHLPTLQGLFPEARFLHMLRDGRDAAVSAFHHQQRIMSQLGQTDPQASLQDSAPTWLSKWAQFTRAVQQAEQGGIPIHTVRYEAMLDHPSKVLRDCLEHIAPDTTWSETDIQEAVNANSFRRQSGRKPGQSSSSSFLRKGQAGSWREELDPATLSRLQPNDQNLLEQLGYWS